MLQAVPFKVRELYTRRGYLLGQMHHLSEDFIYPYSLGYILTDEVTLEEAVIRVDKAMREIERTFIIRQRLSSSKKRKWSY